MPESHILGFPRIGANRETKKSVESYWKGKLSEAELVNELAKIRAEVWQTEKDSGLDYITAGDFCSYDHILDFSVALGVIPERFGTTGESPLNLMFRMARGRAPEGAETTACEMTKWFDTNYHYIVPEFSPQTDFKLNTAYLLDQVAEAKTYGKVKFVIPGALTYLRLGKERNGLADRLVLLNKLKPVYEALLKAIAESGVSLVQIDEPALVLDLPAEWVKGFQAFYKDLNFHGLPSMVTTYFDDVAVDLNELYALPFDIFHFDGVKNPEMINRAAEALPSGKKLSAGVISGRNIWKTDLNAVIQRLKPIADKLGERLMVSAASSLLHTPVDLSCEDGLNPELRRWLAFSVQKLDEINCLKAVLSGKSDQYADYLKTNAADIESRRTSALIHNPSVAQRLADVSPDMLKRSSAFEQRKAKQSQKFQLPAYPTTTIGSFPQTPEIRKARLQYKKGLLNGAEYNRMMQQEIQYAVNVQEEIGLDVPVHGEPERNDMVEYFGEQLSGFAFTKNAWVQSYGTRCVKPPIIFGDVSRPNAMTVEWSAYAQTLTKKPMKGMLTGPVTILQWSFVRDDQPRETTCRQIALALLDEVKDLEKAGIHLIQVDEPALREGLPLRKADWDEYLTWATESFRLATSSVADTTQIHTHMCYCEFNEIMPSIAALDADVISIETSRSQMDLLDSFKDFSYPNDIGPGVYDIHSPRVPSFDEMVSLLKKASVLIPAERLWVNPDCGLKTREWKETKAALQNMVKAAQTMRSA